MGTRTLKLKRYKCINIIIDSWRWVSRLSDWPADHVFSTAARPLVVGAASEGVDGGLLGRLAPGRVQAGVGAPLLVSVAEADTDAGRDLLVSEQQHRQMTHKPGVSCLYCLYRNGLTQDCHIIASWPNCLWFRKIQRKTMNDLPWLNPKVKVDVCKSFKACLPQISNFFWLKFLKRNNV